MPFKFSTLREDELILSLALPQTTHVENKLLLFSLCIRGSYFEF